MREWMTSDPNNVNFLIYSNLIKLVYNLIKYKWKVIAVHCKGGKGNSLVNKIK